MRKRKFRVYDKLRKQLIYLDNGNTHHSFHFMRGYASYYNLQNGSGGDEYDIEEFIGQYDKYKK